MAAVEVTTGTRSVTHCDAAALSRTAATALLPGVARGSKVYVTFRRASDNTDQCADGDFKFKLEAGDGVNWRLLKVSFRVLL
jgi:hypothetical protein